MKEIKKIAIAGAGGLGSYLVQYLYDYGTNRGQYPWVDWEVDLYDNDTVDQGNLLHQNYTMDDLGKRKAEILAEKFLVNPIYEFMAVDSKGKPDSSVFKNYDFVFSCVDNMMFRRSLYEYGWETPDRLVWIDGRCSSRHIGVYNSFISKAKLQRTLSDDTKHRGCLRGVDKQNKVSHATPLIVAGIMTQAFLNYIRGNLPSDAIELMI